MKTQQIIDAYYQQHGPCCAGCDWWRAHNAVAGQCIKSAPVSGDERAAMLGMEGCSLDPGAGHVFTPRDHWCGEFVDTYDWSTHQ